MEFLQDPAVQSVLTLVGIFVAAITAVIIYRKQRQRKSLSYDVVASIPLTQLHPSILWSYQQAGLQFTFKGENIPQANIVGVNFTNTGNVPIKKEDYDEPVSLSFGNKAKILTWRVLEKKPENITIQLKPTSDAGKVIIEPTLLNNKDSFIVEMLVSGFDGQVKVGGRIVGVKEIQDISKGLPISREEELVDEALLLNMFLLLLVIVNGAYFAAVIVIGILIVQGWRKLKLKLIRQMTQKVS